MQNKTLRKIGKPRLLIVGCGDVGMRLLPLLRGRFRIFAVTSQAARRDELHAAGAIPVVADLDRPATLAHLGSLARTIIHLAPPKSDGATDTRTRNLAAILPERATLVYVSTTGVYGDCGGERIDETRPVRPANARAIRRLDAERSLRLWARRSHSRLAIVRTPGIYAMERLPLERLAKGLPALSPEDDVYTNHIHADDLVSIVLAALCLGRPGRVYHASDDSEMKMGEYFDAVADAFALPRPPRMERDKLVGAVSPAMLSFMSESRRLSNARMKSELHVRLKYRTVGEFLRLVPEKPIQSK